MDREILKYWLALKAVEDVGPVAFRTLLQVFPSPREVFSAQKEKLCTIPGIGPKIADNIRSFSAWGKTERELEQAATQGIGIILCTEPLYPSHLLNIYDYPPLIYVRGSLVQEELCVAIVGSRLASVYGRFTTERLSRELALKGITIVSGLARGIDSAAHRGALAGRGRTIAVLGCGVDIVYPPENVALVEKIIESGGAVVSEFPLGTPPNAPNFPARNRIISGMSLGVVVVEAGEKSGSLITARIAAEQGRSVFAVPGEIGSSGSRGTNSLIKQGATLIEGIEDILEEILPQSGATAGAPPGGRGRAAKLSPEAESGAPLLPFGGESPEAPGKTNLPGGDGQRFRTAPDEETAMTKAERLLFQRLSSRPLDIDTLISQSGLSAGEAQNALLTLELAGLITQHPGKNFSRKE